MAKHFETLTLSDFKLDEDSINKYFIPNKITCISILDSVYLSIGIMFIPEGG